MWNIPLFLEKNEGKISLSINKKVVISIIGLYLIYIRGLSNKSQNVNPVGYQT